MKITNNYKGPLGLPDGTILQPGVQTPVDGWEQLKKNSVVQGWLKAEILIAEGGKPSAPAQESLLGSNVLPANIELGEGVSVQLGELVRQAFEHTGLTVAAWNALEEGDREAGLAAMVRELQSRAEAEAEARKAAAAAAAEAEKAKASAGTGTGTQNPPAVDKDALLVRAKELEIDANRTWGVPKLQAAIAEAEARKGEG